MSLELDDLAPASDAASGYALCALGLDDVVCDGADVDRVGGVLALALLPRVRHRDGELGAVAAEAQAQEQQQQQQHQANNS